MMDGDLMSNLYNLLLTIGVGLFFLLGGLIFIKVKNKDKLNIFSISLAFVIMLNLIIVDLIPEVLELLESVQIVKKLGIIIGFTLLGFIVLKVLDKFIPHHHHEHDIGDELSIEHISHVKHIGVLTIFSLILHNIIEGFAIFGLADVDFKIGLMTSISVALHNIPLGMHIFSSIEPKDNKLLLAILTLSSLIGGGLFLIIGEIKNVVLASICAVTLGMVIYIAFWELLPEIWKNKKRKETILGLIIGVIILIVSLYI